jgi:hypothetical protein
MPLSLSGNVLPSDSQPQVKQDLIDDEISLFQRLKEDYQKQFAEEGGGIGSPFHAFTQMLYAHQTQTQTALGSESSAQAHAASAGGQDGDYPVRKRQALSLSPAAMTSSAHQKRPRSGSGSVTMALAPAIGQSKIEQSNPLEWWKQHELRLPLMSSLAKRLFCIPATARPWRFKASVFANFALMPDQLQSTVLLYDVWRRIIANPKLTAASSSSAATNQATTSSSSGNTSKVKSRYSLNQNQNQSQGQSQNQPHNQKEK